MDKEKINRILNMQIKTRLIVVNYGKIIVN